jgi:hypothetical protein
MAQSPPWIHFDSFERDLMGLSTHVLDTMHGKPAAGMAVAFFVRLWVVFVLIF